MYARLETILSELITLIKLPVNKDEFVTTFLKQCRQLTVLGLIRELPVNRQRELQTRLKDIKNGEEGKKIILSYFTPDTYARALDTTSERYFQEYITDLLPTLTADSQKTLREFLTLQ